MRKSIISFLTSCMIIGGVLEANAVKAWPGLLKGKTISGEEISYNLRGDEFAHEMVSEDGFILDRTENGLKKGAAFNAELLWEQGNRMRAIRRNAPMRLIDSGFPTTGSARDYFIDQSSGVFTPEFDVVGPIKLSHNMNYYGANNHAGQDAHPAKMIKEACELAAGDFNVDFSKYDYDNDGFVDFVYVIYASYAESYGASSNTIWPHTAWRPVLTSAPVRRLKEVTVLRMNHSHMLLSIMLTTPILLSALFTQWLLQI